MLCKLWMCNWIRLMQLTDDYLLSVASHWRCCSVAVVAAWKSCRIVEAAMARVASGHLSPCPSMVQGPVEIQMKAIRRFVSTEKAPTRAFSWLKAATTAFTFKTLLRHFAKRAFTPRSLNMNPLIGAFSVITNLRMDFYEALFYSVVRGYNCCSLLQPLHPAAADLEHDLPCVPGPRAPRDLGPRCRHRGGAGAGRGGGRGRGGRAGLPLHLQPGGGGPARGQVVLQLLPHPLLPVEPGHGGPRTPGEEESRYL